MSAIKHIIKFPSIIPNKTIIFVPIHTNITLIPFIHLYIHDVGSELWTTIVEVSVATVMFHPSTRHAGQIFLPYFFWQRRHMRYSQELLLHTSTLLSVQHKWHVSVVEHCIFSCTKKKMQTIVVVIVCVILLVYIYSIFPYAIYTRETRKMKQWCSKNKLCYLDDAFPYDSIPNVPTVLFEYYHKEHLTPTILQQMDAMSKQHDIPYKVVNRRKSIGLFPKDTFKPSIQIL